MHPTYKSTWIYWKKKKPTQGSEVWIQKPGKKHHIRYKVEKSAYLTDELKATRTQDCLPLLAYPECSFLSLDLMSLAAIKTFNLDFPLMARALLREGVGLMIDALQCVFWPPTNRTLGFPRDPSLFPGPVQRPACAFRLNTRQPKKSDRLNCLIYRCMCPFLTLGIAAWKKVTIAIFNKYLKHPVKTT